jgi:hypothetical protein
MMVEPVIFLILFLVCALIAIHQRGEADHEKAEPCAVMGRERQTAHTAPDSRPADLTGQGHDMVRGKSGVPTWTIDD